MKNRAKCKLCNDVLESFHTYDYVTCKCGEISISGGLDRLECSAKNWGNFLRIDENGNEIIVKVQGADEAKESKAEDVPSMNRADKIDMLQAMVLNIEHLPEKAKLQPISHYDMYTYMVIILSILKHEEKS